MNDQAWYLSHIVDPYSDDAIIDQGHINEYWDIQYKCDTIISSISTEEFSINCSLFLSDIISELDDDSLRLFYTHVFKKIIFDFDMFSLEDHSDNKHSMDYNKEVRELISFFSKDYLNFLVKLLYPFFDIKNTYNEQYIKSNRNNIITSLKSIIKEQPYLIKYFFQYDTIDNMLSCIIKLVNLNRDTWIGMLVLKHLQEREKENDKNS